MNAQEHIKIDVDVLVDKQPDGKRGWWTIAVKVILVDQYGGYRPPDYSCYSNGPCTDRDDGVRRAVEATKGVVAAVCDQLKAELGSERSELRAALMNDL